MTTREVIQRLTADISQDYPILANGLLANQLPDDDPLWEWAEVAADHVLQTTGADDQRIAQCTEAFVVTSLDFLRLQARFMKTGRYAHSSAAATSALYADTEQMTDYLDGLALSYVMWPNHTRMLRYFATEFVPALPPAARLLEIGPGHGLLASVLLTRRADVRYTGIDISARSIEYSTEAFAASGISADRYELMVGDACAPDSTSAATTFAAAVCCEVLEHVDDPSALLTGLRAALDEDAPAFLSTVANMEAEDHVYLFHDVEHIRSTIRREFTITSDQPLVLAGAEGSNPKPVNYSAIVRTNSRHPA